MKILICPDSFKGTMSAAEVADILKTKLAAALPACEFLVYPIADGGEGTLDTFYAMLGGEIVTDTVCGPSFQEVSARRLMTDAASNKGFLGAKADAQTKILENEKVRVASGGSANGNTQVSEKELENVRKRIAVIELAEAAGLVTASLNAGKFAKYKSELSNRDIFEIDRPYALYATTYGVGQQIKTAVAEGAEDIILGIGGSATTDGGTGLATALGVKFFDCFDREFVPTGATLKGICKVQFDDSFAKRVSLTVLCDVKNPLYGENGAAYVYAPQKGADENEVKRLDDGLRHLASMLKRSGRDVSTLEGGGAAGGVGAGAQAFLGGTLKSGIDVVLDMIDFDAIKKDVDVIISGEGALDSQSFSGKVIGGIIKRKGDVPLVVFTGIVRGDVDTADIARVYVTNDKNLPFDEVKKNAKQDLERAVDRFVLDAIAANAK